MDNIENVIRVKTWIVSGYMENISKIKTEIYREGSAVMKNYMN